MENHSPFLAKLSTKNSSIPRVGLKEVMQGTKDEHFSFLERSMAFSDSGFAEN